MIAFHRIDSTVAERTSIDIWPFIKHFFAVFLAGRNGGIVPLAKEHYRIVGPVDKRPQASGRCLHPGDPRRTRAARMNTGLVDAVVLGQLLADVLRGRAPEERLDLYEQKQRPAAAEVLALADRLTRVATVRNPVARVLRNLLLRALGASPVFGRKLALTLSGLARKGAGTVPPP